MSPERREELIAAIENTFRGIPRPQCTKRVARALDDEWFPTRERVEELQAMDPETDWREVPDEGLEEYSDMLFWMDGPAFRFYYPAFLRYFLRHWDEPHGGIHCETLEVLWTQPKLAGDLSLMETDFLIAILTEIGATPQGADSMFQSSVFVLEAHRKELADRRKA